MDRTIQILGQMLAFSPEQLLLETVRGKSDAEAIEAMTGFTARVEVMEEMIAASKVDHPELFKKMESLKFPEWVERARALIVEVKSLIAAGGE